MALVNGDSLKVMVRILWLLAVVKSGKYIIFERPPLFDRVVEWQFLAAPTVLRMHSIDCYRGTPINNRPSRSVASRYFGKGQMFITDSPRDSRQAVEVNRC